MTINHEKVFCKPLRETLAANGKLHNLPHLLLQEGGELNTRGSALRGLSHSASPEGREECAGQSSHCPAMKPWHRHRARWQCRAASRRFKERLVCISPEHIWALYFCPKNNVSVSVRTLEKQDLRKEKH